MIRHTAEATPTSPEQIAFTVDEGTVGVRAVSYYLASSLETLESNWDTNALFAAQESVEGADAAIDGITTFVNSCQGLATKLKGPIEQPDAVVELSPEEVMRLGRALFRLGNLGVMRARNALARGCYTSESEGMVLKREVEATAQGTFNLFSKLEPVAKSKVGGNSWMVWKAPLPLPDGQ